MAEKEVMTKEEELAILQSDYYLGEMNLYEGWNSDWLRAGRLYERAKAGDRKAAAELKELDAYTVDTVTNNQEDPDATGKPTAKPEDMEESPPGTLATAYDPKEE
jgi:hypothetical protein